MKRIFEGIGDVNRLGMRTVVFLCAGMLAATLAWGRGTMSVVGRIEKIAVSEEGKFLLFVEHKGRIRTYVCDESTLIQAVAPARELKKGQKVIVARAPDRTKQDSRKLRGPELAKSPELPKKPDLSGRPEIPEPPQGLEQKEAGVASQKQGGPPPSARQKQGEYQFPLLTEPTKYVRDNLAELVPLTLSRTVDSSSDNPVREVVELKETSEGIELELAKESGDKENMVVPPEQRFQRLLNPDDLREGMGVRLVVSKDSEPKFVRQIVILE